MSDAAVTEATGKRVTLPSRPLLEDGKTPNDTYDMTLDPGSGQWQPRKYFLHEDHFRVLVYKDPDSRKQAARSFSINGFTLVLPVEEESVVPRSFAEYLDSLNYQFTSRKYGLNTIDRIDRDGNKQSPDELFRVAKILGPASAADSIIHSIPLE